MNKKCEGIWVWTKKAELRAKELNLEPRLENTPAYMGYDKCGQFAPKAWVKSGYVKEML